MRLRDGFVAGLAIVVGTALQLQQHRLWAADWYAGLFWGSVVLVCAALRVMRRSRSAGWQGAWPLALLSMAVWSLAFAQTGWRAAERQSLWLPAELEGRSLQAEGELVSLPQWNERGVRFRFRIDRLTEPDGTVVSLRQRWVWLGWYGVADADDDGLSAPPHNDPNAAARVPPSHLSAGDRWRWTVRLKAPHGHINPHGFDHELWLWEQGITATGYVRVHPSEPAPVRLRAGGWGVTRLRQSARDAIAREVDTPARAGRIAALLLGDQASIERADWDVFRATGIAHLMAISGLHITALAWLAGRCAGAVWRRSDWRWRGRGRGRRLALWCPTPHIERVAAMLTALGYAVFSGWGIPAQRTVWMLLLVNALALSGRRWPWPLSALVVAAVVITLDPWALTQAGFWLSFVAVVLLFVSGSEPKAQGSAPARLWSHARTLLREQWVMGVSLAPLSLLLFQQVSVVGLVTNLLAVPWITLLVTPLCLVGVVWHGAWSWAALAVDALMPLLQFMASVPGAQVTRPAVPAWVSCFAMLGGACLAWPGPAPWRLSGVCWMLPLFAWQVPQPASGRFELLAVDMGQGHAVLVRTREHALLYDTGPRYSPETDAGQRMLVPLLRALDVRLDRIVVSHQDSDHSGGVASVWAQQPQADVWTSVPVKHGLWSGMPTADLQRCEHGQHWQWDGVRFEILHPAPAEYSAQPARKPNALSCVLRIEDAHGVRALLTGDIEAAQEQALLSQDVHADWLLVPHHGSNTSSTTAFLQAVQPRWAVVQAGYLNRFGHPRPQVLARYQAAGIAVVRTDRCGAASWDSQHPASMRCQREVETRYWRR